MHQAAGQVVNHTTKRQGALLATGKPTTWIKLASCQGAALSKSMWPAVSGEPATVGRRGRGVDENTAGVYSPCI